MNDSYWPSYLFKAKLIPLSKNDKEYTSKKNVRTISVLPALTKVIERIIY